MANEIPSEAYEAPRRAYDKNTYGQVAADHDEGINSVVAAVWELAHAAGRKVAAEYDIGTRIAEDGHDDPA